MFVTSYKVGSSVVKTFNRCMYQNDVTLNHQNVLTLYSCESTVHRSLHCTQCHQKENLPIQLVFSILISENFGEKKTKRTNTAALYESGSGFMPYTPNQETQDVVCLKIVGKTRSHLLQDSVLLCRNDRQASARAKASISYRPRV